MANRPLDGYPTSWGSNRVSIFPHTGPASYTQITYGPLAGGDIVQAGPEAGIKFFDKVEGDMTDSGNYSVRACPINPSSGPVGQPSTTYRLKWFAERTAALGGQNQTAGTEVVAATVLSGEIVRLKAIGPK